MAEKGNQDDLGNWIYVPYENKNKWLELIFREKTQEHMIEVNMCNVLVQDALVDRLNGFRRGLDKFLKDSFINNSLQA